MTVRYFTGWFANRRKHLVWRLRSSLNNSGVCNQDKSLVSWNQSSLNKSFRSSPVIPAKAGIHKSLSWIPARATPDYDPGLAGMNFSI